MATYRVLSTEPKTRLDIYVQLKNPALSRSIIQKLCLAGAVLVNGKPAKASYHIRPKDKISLDYEPNAHPAINIKDIPVIFEDENVIVIDKPVGVLSHSKGGFNPEDTVASWLARRESFQKGWDLNNTVSSNNRLGIVHRLDRATSGVMIAAKNPKAMKYLQKQFADRKVAKHYIALINGTPKIATAKIDVPIARNPKKPATFHADISGKPAVTVYKLLKILGKRSLVELTPKTGRTHQLRVHLNYLGHPIIGDEFYKGEKAGRLMLHAWKLEVNLPSNKLGRFEASLPAEFNDLTNKL